ncbi:NAD synthetase [Tenacibaculum holothuriorum]|uniref:NH(3)-dependent NAD(+) synthetase n=1 Tax=Tenacibaculum holothuriorum TaxID=1635173 RepID=A0A1Y2P8T4_9FLAO|nr:NAD(+) synthase [Tenacibaculum holothuriorum]OSY86866.1 NAD synthetase [Tenacibaculum holothuriorum]
MNTPKVAEHIIKWLKEYAENAKVNGFVVGISGGIDSAVTSTLCAKTGLPTLCVELPIHQAQSQVNRANEHIKQLRERFDNVSEAEVNLTSTFEDFKTVVPEVGSSPKVDLALANTRARLRMTTLYYFAGLKGLLVAGTGNKVEDFGVGFFTKYGDGGVDLSPIADLVKSEVYALGEYLEVPESIQKAQPTDGLFGDSRTDEDQIGASYDELEWAMKMQDAGKTVDDFKDRQQEVFKIYSRLNRINQHKMVPIPVCEIPKNLK